MNQLRDDERQVPIEIVGYNFSPNNPLFKSRFGSNLKRSWFSNLIAPENSPLRKNVTDSLSTSIFTTSFVFDFVNTPNNSIY